MSQLTVGNILSDAGVIEYPGWLDEQPAQFAPMPHQAGTLRRYVNKLRFLDASDPGVGKTYPAQVHGLLMASLGNKTLYVMPPRLLEQFHAEMLTFFPGVDSRLDIGVYLGDASKKAKLLQGWEESGWPDILLMSYDAFRQLNDNSPMKKIGWNQWYLPDGRTYFRGPGDPVDDSQPPVTKDGRPINKRGKAENPHRRRLAKAGYCCLFFDEAHALCGTDSILSESVADMSERLGDDMAIYLMTGTPIPTHLEDVYGLLRLVNPEAYSDKTSFMRQHCLTETAEFNGRNVRVIVGYKNEELVHKNLFANAVRIQKRDVLELKDPLISSVSVRLSGPHLKLYRELMKQQFTVLGDTVLAPDNQSSLRHLALQIVSCPDEFDPSGKLTLDNELAKAADEILDSINPANHKVIIFAYYQRTIDFLAKRYAQWCPAVVNGNSSSDKNIARFKTDPNCRLCIVNWKSGGAGLNLQVASHILFYETPTSPGDAKQAIARCDRKGQENIVNVYFMRVRGTIFDRNYQSLLRNEQQANAVIRDRKDLLFEYLGRA